MAASKSAKKRIVQNANRRAQNRWRKRAFRTAVKEYDELILHGSVEDATTKLQSLYKLVDRTAAKGAIHRNAAARYKSRLTGKLNTKKTASA